MTDTYPLARAAIKITQTKVQGDPMQTALFSALAETFGKHRWRVCNDARIVSQLGVHPIEILGTKDELLDLHEKAIQFMATFSRKHDALVSLMVVESEPPKEQTKK